MRSILARGAWAAYVAVDDGASTDRRAAIVQGPPMSLSQAQLADLVRQFEARHTALLEEVRAALESSENLQYIELLDRAPADIGDQSVADALADFNLAIVDRHVRELRDIEAAKGTRRGSHLRRVRRLRRRHRAGAPSRLADGATLPRLSAAEGAHLQPRGHAATVGIGTGARTRRSAAAQRAAAFALSCRAGGHERHSLGAAHRD